MKIIMSYLVVASLLIASALGSLYKAIPSDNELRDHAVRLGGITAYCSGVQVKAPSGGSFILTAGHCRNLIKPDGKVNVISDMTGDRLERKVIAESEYVDLLLLEGIPGVEGLPIAKSVVYREPVRAFTHPLELDVVKSEGVMLHREEYDFPTFSIDDDEALKKCTSAFKRKVVPGGIGYVCQEHMAFNVTSAKVDHGSSGGMLVNSAGEVVGIISAKKNSNAYGLVSHLEDIQIFLSNY